MTIKENPYVCSVCNKPIQYKIIRDTISDVYVEHEKNTQVYKNDKGFLIFTCPRCVRFKKIKKIKSKMNGKKLFRLFVR